VLCRKGMGWAESSWALRPRTRSANLAWSQLTNDAISVHTVGRIMALNKQIYDDILHVPSPAAKKPPGLHPYKATHAHN
jgi:hypothetical protein